MVLWKQKRQLHPQYSHSGPNWLSGVAEGGSEPCQAEQGGQAAGEEGRGRYPGEKGPPPPPTGPVWLPAAAGSGPLKPGGPAGLKGEQCD